MEIGDIIKVSGKEYKIENIIFFNSPNEFELILSMPENTEVERNVFGKLWYGFLFVVYYPAVSKIKGLFNWT